MITWVPTTNEDLHMASIKVTPGDLIIQDTASHSVRIRRFELSHAEHILGIWMATQTQMTTDFNYRLGQACELSSRICCTLLQRSEAKATYRHLIHITSYCLSITTFSSKHTAKLVNPVCQDLTPPPDITNIHIMRCTLMPNTTRWRRPPSPLLCWCTPTHQPCHRSPTPTRQYCQIITHWIEPAPNLLWNRRPNHHNNK